MTTKHTPGPWLAVARTNAHIEIEAPGQPGYSAKKVATVSLINHEANARLIAVAPMMYEYIATSASNGCAEAKKLVAKAEGKV